MSSNCIRFIFFELTVWRVDIKQFEMINFLFLFCFSQTISSSFSLLTNPNPHSAWQKGILQHSNGKCLKTFVPKQMSYRLSNQLTTKHHALLQLVDQCSEADVWQITELFTLKSLTHNLTVYTTETKRADGSQLSLLTAYVMLDADEIEQFAYLDDGRIVHVSTNHCIQSIQDSELNSKKLRGLSLLVLTEECNGKNVLKMQFRNEKEVIEVLKKPATVEDSFESISNIDLHNVTSNIKDEL